MQLLLVQVRRIVPRVMRSSLATVLSLVAYFPHIFRTFPNWLVSSGVRDLSRGQFTFFGRLFSGAD